MGLRQTLHDLVRVVVEEAERNPEFSSRLEEVLSLRPEKLQQQSRPANRRAPAVLDPVDLARQGESVLRERLQELSLDQLKDIVADYGMDTSKLVLKWKTPERIIDHIAEVSIGRAKKGEGFLSSGSNRNQP